MYDIVFISYNEPNADDNFKKLKRRFPTAKRVHGVKGIHQAHIAGAKKCNTYMFWIVDGDAVIQDNFDFTFKPPVGQEDMVHIWRSRNPVNGLVYGYGGVKLFPKEKTINMDTNTADMTTSISDVVIHEEIANVTAFNTDEFNTWKSAFRECVKLSSNAIRNTDKETANRLKIWCSVGEEREYGKYSLQGANSGRRYGHANIDNEENLKLINNFEWLRQKFEQEAE